MSSDGNIESETDGKKLPGKSLDFSWKTGDKTFYAMHKYTAESGGSQDQQFGEMLELMKRFTSCQNQDVVLLIIVDGEYYQKNDQERLEKLRHLQRGKLPRSFALSINEIPHLISQYTE